MGFLKRLFLGREPDPEIIVDPKLGLFNLLGDDEMIVDEDREELGPMFPGGCEVAVDVPPRCEVLLIYARIGKRGRVSGTTLSPAQIVSQAGAGIVFVASEGDSGTHGEAFTAFAKGLEGLNLGFTVSRNGAGFVRFFRGLFEQMFEGTSMPVAWVNLAPQNPGLQDKSGPEVYFACGRGHIAFERSIDLRNELA